MKQLLTKLLILLIALMMITSTLVVLADNEDTSAAEETTVTDDASTENSKDDDTNADDTKKDDDTKDDDTEDDDSKDDDAKDDDTKKDDEDDDSKDDDTKDDDTKKDDEDDDTKKDNTKASVITYKGEVDEAIELDEADFVSEYKSVTGKTFSRLTFTSLPASSSGILYYDYDGKEEAKVTKNKAISKSLLADISFVPKKSGTVSVPYSMTGTSSSDPTVTGTVQFTIAEAKGADAISYSGKSGSAIEFSASDFKSVCKEETGKTLDYVKFTLPSSSSGVLYYDYDGKEEAKVTKSAKYYASDDPDLSLVSFVPKASYTGTLSISYTGYNTSGKSYTGTVKVKVTASSSSKTSTDDDDDADTISYTVSSTKVTFDADDFIEVCEDATDADLVKIVFTSLPASSAGVLYLGYKSSSKYEDKVSKSEDYYPDDDPAISDISFVPKSGYSGTVTISYRGYYSKSKYYTGKISIRVKSTSKDEDEDEDEDQTIATISETLTQNETADINASSLSSAFKKASGKALSYVKFSLPSSSSGTLFYDYDGDDEAKVKASDKYYASKNPYLKYVTFVPAKKFTGSVTLTYTAYATSGSGYTGKIKLTYKATAATKTDDEKTTGKKDNTTSDTTLSYKVKNNPLALSITDFNDAAIRATDAAVSWVKLGLVNESAGALYYKYGEEGQTLLSAGSVVYSDRAPLISDVSFVPKAGYKGEIYITYTAESLDDDSFSGQLHLTIRSAKKHFRDVAETSWYADIVDTVCDADLMKGTGEDTFSPEASMTVAEALTMGARLHNQIKGGTDSDFVASGNAWYDVYVSYAIQNGIIRGGDFDDYTREATRAEMAYIFYHSVTLDYLAKINDRTVPDVSTEDLFGQEIYGLYDAGILTGNDEAGTFRAASHITRAEAATILGRTGNVLSRVKK